MIDENAQINIMFFSLRLSSYLYLEKNNVMTLDFSRSSCTFTENIFFILFEISRCES